MCHYYRVSKNFMLQRVVTIFRRKFFVSLPKNAVAEPFSLSIISGIDKVWMRGWGAGGGGLGVGKVKIFRRKFFVSKCRKTS